MSVRSRIQAVLGRVITIHGETWSYRKLMSGPSADPRLYTAWTPITAHVTGRVDADAFDEQRSTWSSNEKGRFRVAEADAILNNGDQVVLDPLGGDEEVLARVWAITATESSSVGTVAYTIERVIPLRVEANRQGGV